MLLRSLPSQPSFRPVWSAVHAAGQLPTRCRGGHGAAGRLPLAHSKFSNRIAAANEARSFATESNPSTDHIEDAAAGTGKGNGAFEGTTEQEGRNIDAVEVAERAVDVPIRHVAMGNQLSRPKKRGGFVMRSVRLRLEQSGQSNTDAGGAEQSSGASEKIAGQGGQSFNASNTAETERDALMRKFSRTGLSSSPSPPRRGPRRDQNTTAARGKNAVPSKVFHGKAGVATPKLSYVRSGSRKGHTSLLSDGPQIMGANLESARRKMDERRGMDRLEKLMRVESLLRSDAAQAGGKRIGAITRDTIMDDDAWQRLKQEVGKIGKEKAEPLDGAQAKEHECHENQEMGDENSSKDEDAALNQGGRRERKRKADPAKVQSKNTKISVRERLRQAIGNIHSTLSAELEDHPQPSRYRQDVHPAPRTLQEQRLQELEALLIEASQRLRELKGYQTSEGHGSFMPGLSSDVPPKQTVNMDMPNSDSHDTALENLAVHTGNPPSGVSSPRRYLSRDPSRPLPHTTEQAIPAELFGPRKSLSSSRPGKERELDQESHRTSHLEDIFVHTPERNQLKDEPSSPKNSLEFVDKPFPSVHNEVLPPMPDAHRKKQTPLLNELFPELVHGGQRVQQPAHEEHEVPKLSLDFQEQNIERRPNLIARNDWTNKRMQEMYVNDIVVLHLHGLSRNLSEEDIKRLVPQASKDIEGWSDPDFIKVIPVRDDYTLERLDQYYVVFRNVRSARAFQDRVRILHAKTKAHATSSLLSALPPPPGFRDDRGDDIHAALQSYTIGAPASDKVYCNIVPYPYPHKLHDLLARGGYEPIVGAGGATGADADIDTVAKVLLWFIGPQPTIGELRKTIARDSKDRGMPWAVVDGIHSPEGVIRLTHHSKNGPADSDASEDRIERKVGVRYVINFENRGEAQRFSRRWHREAFRWGDGVYENGEGPPEARAEVLW